MIYERLYKYKCGSKFLYYVRSYDSSAKKKTCILYNLGCFKAYNELDALQMLYHKVCSIYRNDSNVKVEIRYHCVLILDNETNERIELQLERSI